MKYFLFSFIFCISQLITATVAHATQIPDDTFAWPLVSTAATGQTIVIGGQLDLTKYTDRLSDISIELQIATVPFPANQAPEVTTSSQFKYRSHKLADPASAEGINDTGEYYWYLNSLNPASTYFCRQITYKKNTGVVLNALTTNCVFNSGEGIIPAGSVLEKKLEDQKTYHLLAPWPGLTELMDPDLCQQKKLVGALPPNAICDINGFLDFAFKTLIAITAVILVLRLIVIGYEYMVTDTPFRKASSKDAFLTSLTGLLLALSAYLILNTINPKLVSNTFSINSLNLGVEDLVISGPASFDGTSVKVNFKKDIYPNALKATQKTGIDTALIIAMFQQETNYGANYGKCRPTIPNSNMKQVDYEYLSNPLIGNFNTIINTKYRDRAPLTLTSVNISCSSGAGGNGGAIGYTQFMPTTWKEYVVDATSKLGHAPFPWDTGDSLMMTALFLKNKGAGSTDASQSAAACKYFGSCTKNGGPWLVPCGNTQMTYGDCVVAKKKSIQQQIDSLKAKGEL